VITYRIDISKRHAHVLRVTLTVAKPQALHTLSLPVWIPGSYMVREFSRHLSQLQACQGRRSCHLTQTNKTTWQVATQGSSPLVLTYEVYAFDTSVRTAFLNAERCFFNGTSVCLRVHGQEHQPHRLALRGMPKAWCVATAMQPAEGVHAYMASDYDELVDHPFEIGVFWRGQFKVAGVVHEIVVTGAWPHFDGQRLLEDTKKICETEIAFWHGPKKKPPFNRYVFMLLAVDEGYGGLEHRASTALIAARRDLPTLSSPGNSEGYTTLLGLISHEYFHTWNVKRMRPVELTCIDYTQENYTELLWFFEGFTSYYDDLFLLRCGHIDVPRYLKLLAKTATAVRASPGRYVQSLAQASFDAWGKYYRSDENTPNATISYYTKGSLVALALDLTLRAQGTGSLDDVMRALWQTSRAGPISEADIVQALSSVAGRDMAPELLEWVHGTTDLDLPTLLTPFGITFCETAPSTAQLLGVRISESALTGIKVNSVLHASAAQLAGVSAGDEILGANQWRLRRLDDLRSVVDLQGSIELLVSRDQRLLILSCELPSSAQGGPVALNLVPEPGLSVQAQQLRQAWLNCGNGS
jgi:predicted metalloprotease with PDZ domain